MHLKNQKESIKEDCYSHCRDFFDQYVFAPECIYQSDVVQDKMHEFLEELYEIMEGESDGII